MKIIVFLAIFSLLYANVKYIVDEIMKIEKIKPLFIKVEHYDAFECEANKTNKAKENVIPKTTKKYDYKLKVYAIFQDKVNINGKWFKIGDTIDGYKIAKVVNNGVYLIRSNKTLKLSITNHILKIK